MSKSEEKRIAIQKADKMAKPSTSVRDFNFPAQGVTVQARDIRDAETKLKESLKPKQKSDD